MPWSDMGSATNIFISEEYLPPGASILDPSKLTKAQTERLLDFWRDRQENMDEGQVFRFLHYFSGGRKKIIAEAEYPDGQKLIKKGPPRQKRGRTTENGRSGIRAMQVAVNPSSRAQVRIDEWNARRSPNPSHEAVQVESGAAVPQTQPTTPATPRHPRERRPTTLTAAHSYQGFLPPPLPDGSGPLAEIQYQSARLAMAPQ